MKTLGILLITAIIWTQVTPSDDKGCAGYTPTIVRESQSIPHQPVEPSSEEEFKSEDSEQTDDYEPEIGDNQGTGQFDESSQSNQW